MAACQQIKSKPEPARGEPGCGLCVHYRVLYALEKHEMESRVE
eukprot:COSAG06_NODE_1394_length_9596_cov_3.949458_2_plen_43_part_00